MSNRVRLILAALIVLVAVASMVDLQIPSRPTGAIDDLAELRERKVNVVFILVGHAPGRPHERVRIRATDDAAPGGALQRGRPLRQRRGPVHLDQVLHGLALDGTFPPATGVNRFLHGLPDAVRTPAELFREAGYATAGIWRNGWVAPNFGFDQGFDLYVQPATKSDLAAQEYRADQPGARVVPGTDADITEGALSFMRTHQDEPFFLYLHYMDVHQFVYDVEAAELGFGARIEDSYDASIHWTDRNVAIVVGELERLGLLENTIVVLASDHGEAFREHGVEGHARDLYQEVTRVPFLVMLPFRLDEPLVVEPLVRNVDVFPTILDLAGLPPLEHADGVSLVPLMQAAARGEAEDALTSVAYLDQHWGQMERDPAPLIAVKQADKRIIWRRAPGEDPGKGRLLAFDHAEDPGRAATSRGRRPLIGPGRCSTRPTASSIASRPGATRTRSRSTRCTRPSSVPSATWWTSSLEPAPGHRLVRRAGSARRAARL